MDQLPQLENLTPAQVQAAQAVAIALGTLYCFLGYRVLKVVIGVTGFVLAGGFAAGVASWLSGGNLIAVVVAGLVGGIAGALSLFFLYKAGVFCIGFLAALLIAHSALGGWTQPWVPWAILGLGAVGGVVSLILERPVMTLATAAIGAWVVVSGVAYILMGPQFTALLQHGGEDEKRWMLLACWAVLGLAGAFAQFATHTHRMRRERRDYKGG